MDGTAAKGRHDVTKLVAMMVYRNEQWVLGCSARVALRWCDEIVILDHGSTDATPDIISDLVREHPGRVHTIRLRATSGWVEQTHRQMAFARARTKGATHFAIVDADEVPTGNMLEHGGAHLRRLITEITPVQYMAGLHELCLWDSLDDWRVDGVFDTNRDIVVGFPDAPNLHWAPREDGYHLHARYPMFARGISNPCPDWRGGGIMHLQFASMRRHRAKNWWYRMVERIQHPTKRTAEETNELYGWPFVGEPVLHRAPAHWWDGIPERRHIDLDLPPWHEQEIERLLAEHGPETFRGLYIGPYTERLAA